MKKKTNIIESVIMAVIILVMVQTFLEDFAVLLSMTWNFRKILIVSGFGFDLFFTVEFLIRFFNAVINRKIKDYLFYRRGWIDFIASIPLLVFNSGPAVYALYTGMIFAGGVGLLNILKVVKAVRIARILRLLRVLKIFKQIKFADSKMAQRHTAKIITTSVTVLIFVITLSSMGLAVLNLNDVENAFSAQQEEVAAFIASEPSALTRSNDLKEFCLGQGSLIKVLRNGDEIYSLADEKPGSRSKSYYEKFYGPADYQYIELDEYEFYFDLKPQLIRQSRDNLIYFAAIVFMILLLMVTYSPHFAITVSDPINVMIKGLKEKSYNLEVSIPEKYKTDDIFVLADKYNEEYLPMKARANEEGEEGSALDISMDDIEDLLL